MDALFWSLWLLNGVLVYVNVCIERRRGKGKWTRADRLIWLPTCLVGGTLLALILLVIAFGMGIGRSKWAQREVRW